MSLLIPYIDYRYLLYEEYLFWLRFWRVGQSEWRTLNRFKRLRTSKALQGKSPVTNLITLQPPCTLACTFHYTYRRVACHYRTLHDTSKDLRDWSQFDIQIYFVVLSAYMLAIALIVSFVWVLDPPYNCIE